MLLKQKKQIANLYLWMKNQIANAVLRDDPASNEDTSSRVAMHDLSSLPVVERLAAQYLIKTGSATRQMSTASIISRIPQDIAHP